MLDAAEQKITVVLVTNQFVPSVVQGIPDNRAIGSNKRCTVDQCTVHGALRFFPGRQCIFY